MNALAAIVLALIAAGCSPRSGNSESLDAIDPVVYMDRLTGCQYLSTGKYTALTPRMSADGKQICLVVTP
jgi:hypothetical protein